MLFNSYEFLFLFLPLVLAGYYFLPRPTRMILLTLASYLFYGWWDFRFCSLLLISTLVDYLAGARIHASAERAVRRRWLILSLASNLSLLGFFKYFDLFAGTVNRLALLAGAPAGPLLPLLHLVLPVGISFYTFQSMSYSIDIYRGHARPAEGFWSFAAYVSLFPQLVAGPIVRYHEVADQLARRSHTWAKAAAGISFFILGLAKKVIIADGVAVLAETVFAPGPAPGLLASWIGVLAYAMQIYFDFSGYSDMAVGLGLLLGFRFPQNFHSPYKAVSITDFWRRWHISLSQWLRDYLYIPLGGSRKGPLRTYVNLFITMLLGGLWHGASWTFMLWGGYHGLLLAIERAAGKRGLFGWAPVALQRAFTFGLVLVGWVLFRAPSLERAREVLRGMAGLGGLDVSAWTRLQQEPLALSMLGIALLMTWSLPNTWEIRWRFDWRLALVWCVLFAVCVMTILVNASSPFLYFQF
jgi:alginate O-acetyltransferase complex protein AlgI